MNIPHRSVSGLSGDEVTSLNGPVKNHDSYRVRRRSPLLFCRVPENPASTLPLQCAEPSVIPCLHGRSHGKQKVSGDCMIFRAAERLRNRQSLIAGLSENS
jgi:hypothetical protein